MEKNLMVIGLIFFIIIVIWLLSNSYSQENFNKAAKCIKFNPAIAGYGRSGWEPADCNEPGAAPDY